MALTDHNTVDGLPDFISAAAGKAIEIVPGAEFSVDHEGRELHLLGLFIPKEAFGEVTLLMQSVNARKEQSNLELVASLSRAGIVLDYDAIKNGTPNGKVNRAHIAAALTKAGYTGSSKEAFATLLSPEAGHYKEPSRLTVWETIDFIRSIDAVPVLAHPFLNQTLAELTVFLPTARARGLVGMECYYSLFDATTTDTALSLAKCFDLLPSGGSDFHGECKPDIALGTGKGNLQIPFAWYEALKRMAK